MTHDLQEIKLGLAQARAALDLLEKLIGEYESRMVNILPAEEIKFHRASDDDVISGPGLGELTSLNKVFRDTAEELHTA